jgi:hypothetical protein
MIAAGIISGPDDPKWHSMSAEEAAKLLSESELDPSTISDPSVRRALMLAKRIASGDHTAAHELVAHHRVHHEQISNTSAPRLIQHFYVSLDVSSHDLTAAIIQAIHLDLAELAHVDGQHLSVDHINGRSIIKVAVFDSAKADHAVFDQLQKMAFHQQLLLGYKVLDVSQTLPIESMEGTPKNMQTRLPVTFAPNGHTAQQEQRAESAHTHNGGNMPAVRIEAPVGKLSIGSMILGNSNKIGMHGVSQVHGSGGSKVVHPGTQAQHLVSHVHPNPSVRAQSFASIWQCMREVQHSCTEGLNTECASHVSVQCKHMIGEIASQCGLAIERNDVCGGVAPGLPLLRCLRKRGSSLYFSCMHTLSKYTPKSEVHGLWRCWVNVRDACGQSAFSIFGFENAATQSPPVEQCIVRPGAVLPQCRMLPSVVASCKQDVAELCGHVATPGKFIGCVWNHRFQVSPVCKAKYEMLSGHTLASITPPAAVSKTVAVNNPPAATATAAPTASSSVASEAKTEGKGPLWKCMDAATTICKGEHGTSLAACAMRMVKVSPVCRVPIGEMVTGCGEDAHNHCATVEMGLPLLQCLERNKHQCAEVCSALLKNNEAENIQFNTEVRKEWQTAMNKGMQTLPTAGA